MRYLYGMILLAASFAVAATEPWQEYDKFIKSAQTIKTEGPGLFGDSVNLYTGATQFTATDVSLTGNNSLPVSIGRRFSPQADSLNRVFSDWDWDVPYIGGTFGREVGWVIGTANRCSGASTLEQARPPWIRVTSSTPGHSVPVESWEYWSGYRLFTPQGGDQEVLFATTDSKPKPTDGAAYPWVTNKFWYLSCLPSLKSGQAGEGFLARSPDGTRYYFDWMVARQYDDLVKPFAANGTILNRPVPRDEIRLYPTRIEDRFGNWVAYTWEADRLTTISASDGRRLTVAWEAAGSLGNRIVKITTNTTPVREWHYGYTAAHLSSVTLPDNSQWKINFGLLWGEPYYEQGQELTSDGRWIPKQDQALYCSWMRALKPLTRTASIQHPSGAVSTFVFQTIRHGRTFVPENCMLTPDLSGNLPDETITTEDLYFSMVPARFDVLAIQSKSITGPGLPSQTWSYAYTTPIGGWVEFCPNCPRTKTTTVTELGGKRTVYTYGVVFNDNEGQLLKSEVFAGNTLLQSTTNTYLSNAAAPQQPFPDRIGITPQMRLDSFSSERLRPIIATTSARDNVTFTSTVNSFDAFANPASTVKSSSLGYTRTESTAYHDDLSKWVLGQVKRNTTNGTETARTEFTANAQPWKTYAFGKLQQTLGYDTASTAASGQRGTLKTVADGRNNVTTLTGWKRGIPGKVTYPATTDQPTAVSQSALVNDDGTLAQVTDENGFVTKYQYDAMGRLTLIDYPDGDTVAWSNTGQSFTPATTARYGLPVGHWVQVVATGGGRKVIDYDALWRPVVESTYISGDAASNSLVVKRYDAAGRLAFQSYPLASLANYADTALKGTYYTYDALDRVTKLEQDWEGTGKLTTTTEYLPGFQTRVTQPRHTLAQPQQTTTSYLAWDQPTYDYPRGINHPEGAYTSIYRNIFGNPYAIARYNADNSVRQTRWYVYDAHQQLCKTIDDETGATVMHYDGAGNLDWSGSGLNALASTTDCQHDHATVAARKVTRTYDARNRLKTLSFPNGVGNTTSTYTPDSLLASLVADNGGGQIVTTSYTYNRRRLLEMEQMQWGAINWPVDYAYNTNGHLASQTFSGLLTDYAPDALGRPTKAGTSASGVSYHPNGAIKQFTYGNGITHTLTQNVRGLPDTSCDSDGACGAASVLNDGYDYDQNGNVAAISDGRTGNRGHRTMIYDALDRLTRVGSRMFGTTGAVTNAFYFYDVLDNLTRTKILDRDHYYCYNAHRQLAFVRTGAVCTGSTPSPAVTALEYDVQGNLSDKNSQTFAFDFGNRLRGVNTPASSYVYDGHGRRVRDYTTASKYSLYSSSGQLVFDSDGRTGLQHWYVYLQGSLVAIRERNTATNVYTTQYQHTDALGSPVAVTNAARTVIEKSEYEPFGKVINHPAKDGPGYTGHVLDAATGMNYMQQRYYDPAIGRFLSVDPVTAYSNGDMRFFNRYAYANNNPYRFTDPDGRQSADRAYGAAVGYMLRDNPEAMRIWAGGEAAAGTEGSAAEQGAAMGRAAGEFADTGDFSKAAVAGAVVKGMAAAITKGKYTPGGKFSRSTKQGTAERAGRKCEYCGTGTVQAKKSEAGVTPPKNEGVTDHVEPRSQGGDNSPGNAAHACRECNGKFSDTPKPHPRDELKR